MSHGLPADTRRSDLGWNETLGYLNAICLARRPVLVRVSESRPEGDLVLQTRGFLSMKGAQQGPPGCWFGMNWPLSETLNGSFFVSPLQFEGGSLSTFDGDSIFALTIGLGTLDIAITDLSTNDWPQPDRKVRLQLRSLMARFVKWFFYTRPAAREGRTSSTFRGLRAFIERRFAYALRRRMAKRDPKPPPSKALAATDDRASGADGVNPSRRDERPE
jgi:hypothetical protein